MKCELKFLVIYAALLSGGVTRTVAPSATRVRYGNLDSSFIIPCDDAETTPVTRCSWAVPEDVSGPCSGYVEVSMTSMASGQYPTLAAAGGDSLCHLNLAYVTQGDETLWLCKDITFQLFVNGVSAPTLFGDGRQMDNGSLLTTLRTNRHTLQCSAVWSHPAASIRWVVGDQSDVSDHATTASFLTGTMGNCPAIEGVSTWQVTSSLPISFVRRYKSVSCVIGHTSLTNDLIITIKQVVFNGAAGLTSAGTMNAAWCLLAAATALIFSAPPTGSVFIG